MEEDSPIAVIGILDKPASLAPVQAVLLRTPFSFEDIVVIFDFDQTLTQKDGVKGSIRGGEPTRRFLTFMNENGIKWYINTARGPGSVGAVATAAKNFGIPLSPIPILEGQQACMSTKPGLGYMGTQLKDKNGVEIGICDNLISAGYNKDIATDFILENLKQLPKLVIFVDDNAINVYNLYQYFVHDRPNINYLGIVYEPYVSEEEDHKLGWELIHKSGARIEPIHTKNTPYNANWINKNIKASMNKKGGKRKTRRTTNKRKSRSRSRNS